MPLPAGLRLSLMMFLQHFVWGAWYVPMYTYLSATRHFPGDQINTAYSCTALAAILSPFFGGMIADRFFASQRVLAFPAIGATALFALFALTFHESRLQPAPIPSK